nr:piggyBac transposable element-derived protein 2-like [Leptinotarsa decemlineata]
MEKRPTKIDMPETNGYADRLEIMKNDLENFSPVQLFEKIFDDDIFQHIRDQTNLYSTQKNNHSFSVDLKIFFGILLLSGYHRLPREKLYWSLGEDLGVAFVSNAMSRNRFQEIKKYIHLANNDELDNNDKMAKIRPLMKSLNQKFQQYGVFHQELSIDEAMVKYFGHHSAKQFIRGKPVRFGYKDWMLCGSTGYCYAFDTYCGAKISKNQTSDENLPLGSKVVLDLLEIVAVPSDHIVYFDNYFTSHALLKTLKDSGQRATGTVRENRTKKCPLSAVKLFQKRDRGEFEYVYDSDSLLLFVRWKDNNVVTMATNHDSVEPLGQVRRWSTAAKSKVQVPQPKVFQNYNHGMGGVDLQDQAVNNYRINIRGKKWWWVLFTHMINVSVVNAWRLHQLASQEKMDLLAFQRDIARHYLVMFLKGEFSRTRPSVSLPDGIRLQEGGHFPNKLDKQLRCKQCHMRARWFCAKCGVQTHPPFRNLI